MKHSILKQIILLSKYTLYGIILQSLFFSILVSADGFSQKKSLEEIYVTLRFEDEKLKHVFNTLQKETDFNFIYNNNYVSDKLNINAAVTNQPLASFLRQLSKDYGLQFKRINTNIFVYRQDTGRPDLEEEIRDEVEEILIRGKVTSSDNEPLPGVNILVKGTLQGTVTDANGNYQLNVPDEGTVLVFSFVGFITEEVTVGDRTVIDISLVADMTSLQEVVVIGYGQTTKRSLTGAVEQIKTKELVQNMSTNAGAALQGRLSGVQVLQQGGAPGTGVRIRIRGVSSINSGSDPLIVVDGVPSGYDLNDINPNDIASMEILKDASAGAIYGSRAANGVVLITTKRGKTGEGHLEIDYQRGVSNPTNTLDLLNGPQYLQVTDQGFWNEFPDRQAAGEVAPVEAYGIQGFNRSIAEQTNTDWRDQITQQAGFHQINVSTGGGTERTQFFASGQYRDEDSYIKGDRFRRINVRLNLDHQIKPWLKFGTNLTGTFTFQDVNSIGNELNDARTNNLPIYPIFSPENTNEFFNGRDEAQIRTNVLYEQEETWRDVQRLRGLTNVYLLITPVKGLTLRSDFSLNFGNHRNRVYKSRDYQRAGEGIDPNAGGGSIRYERGQFYNWNIDNVLTYNRGFGEHEMTLMVGSNAQSFFSDANNVAEEGFPSDYFNLTNSNTEVVMARVSTPIDEYRFTSFFGRAQYNFRNRYFAEFNYRTDASSRFGPENRWGYFPGGALAWVISEEGFMRDLNAIDFLKLRVSYGSVGNAEMGNNFPYLSRLVGLAPYGGRPGFLFRNIGNKAVEWEKQVQLNVGMDFSLLNDRISGSVEYFDKDSRDLLVSYRIGSYHGYFNTSININLGELNNRGFDFNIQTQNLTGNLKWSTNFNISRAIPEVTRLSPFERNIDSGTNRVVEGQPLGAYFLPVWAGVDPETGHELIYEVNQGESANREPYIDDLTGNVIDANRLGGSEYNNQRVILSDKTPYPDFYGGINNTFSYGGFELSFLFSYQFGNYIYDRSERQQSYPGPQRNLRTTLLDGWTRENPTNVPLLWNSLMSGRENTRYLYDGSFIRLRMVQLGYTLPSEMAGRIGLNRLRVYLTGQNLLTITDYPGLDPELYSGDPGREANLAPGIAGLSYPQMRTFTVGLQIGL